MIVINRVDEIGAAFRRDCFSDRSLRERSNRYLLGTESVIRSSDRGARGDTVPVDWDASEKWVIFPRHRPIRRVRRDGRVPLRKRLQKAGLARTRVKTDKWDPT